MKPKQEMRIEDFSWSKFWLIASLTTISIATISPFNFTIPPGFSGEYVLREFEFGSSLKDYWQNILLFVPFGISLGFTSSRPRLTTGSILAFISIASILSVTIETTQLFLPTRVSNLSDIVCNSLGVFFGALVYDRRGKIMHLILGVVTQNLRLLSLKSLLWAIASYCAFVALAIAALLANINLSNWNNDFYLTIGNETTGDRPWEGQISSLHISDRGLEPSEVKRVFQQPDVFFARSINLVASFQLITEKDYYSDRTQHLSPLVWQHPISVLPSNRQVLTNKGLWLNSTRWLQTDRVAAPLNQQLKQTGELSLYLTVSSHKAEQFGPARIVTLSDGIYGQNILLGQSGRDLSLRLRTPITGSNATQPEFVVPEVFDRSNICRILVTFARRKLDVYINSDSTKYSFEFTPTTSFLSYFPWEINNWIINLAEFPLKQYQLLFITVIATPLGILTATLVHYLIMQLGERTI